MINIESKDCDFNTQKIKFGLQLSPEDERDFQANATFPQEEIEEFFVPNYDKSPIYNQENYPMCVDFSIKSIKEIVEYNLSNKFTEFSNGFVYLNRVEDDLMYEDSCSGMIVREMANHIIKDGIPKKSDFNYLCEWKDGKKLNLLTEDVKKKASEYKVECYVKCNNKIEMKNALVYNKTPLLIVMPVNEQFRYISSVIGKYEFNRFNPPKDFYGYHAMVVVGFKKLGDSIHFLVKNSWGDKWKKDGYCWIHEDCPFLEAWCFIDINPKPVNKNKITEKLFRLQMGDFLDKKSRDNMIKKLNTLKIPFAIRTIKRNNSEYYKIQIGVFKTLEEAEQKRKVYEKYKFPNLNIFEY